MTVFVAEKELQARDIAHALVEEPIKRANHYVCGDDIITWSFGHIYRQYEPHEYDPRYADRKNVALLPIVPPNDGWQIVPATDKAELLESIQALMRKADVIINACDPDREGQLIFHEILENTTGLKPNVVVLRLDTSAGLSKAAIRTALGEMESNLTWLPQAEAALARSQTDWLDGMNQSRAVAHAWYKSVRGDRGAIAYGRVLIPTVALVVARDEEIETFVPRDYFVGMAIFQKGDDEFLTTWQPPEGLAGLDDKGRVVRREIVDHMVSRVMGQRGKVVKFEATAEFENAPPPHNLLTLQAAADRAYGLSAKQVLNAAQSLYAERLMISYPRTKSKHLPDGDHGDHAISVLHAIAKNDLSLGGVVDGADPVIRSNAFDTTKMKAGKQAIAPLPVYRSISDLSEPERQVYDLICRAYVAQFYPPASYEIRTVEIAVDADTFTARRKLLIEPGWRVCYPERKAPTTEGMIPVDLKAGDRPACVEAATVAKKTEPPRRYTIASLLERMVNIDALVPDESLRKKLAETDGLGTDATRADIIERAIEKYGYLERKGTFLHSTWRARGLVKGLPDILTSPVLTATLELILDQIAAGEVDRSDYLDDYAYHLREQLEVTKNITFPNLKPKEDGDAVAAGGTSSRPARRTA